MSQISIIAASIVLGIAALGSQEEPPTAEATEQGAQIGVASEETVTAEDAALEANEEKVCKKQKVTGTRISRNRKVCMTRSEWDELARKSREEFDRINGPLLNPCENNRCESGGTY